MKTKSKHADDLGFVWNRKKKRTSGKQFPVTEFLQENYRKVEKTLLGPGCGAGIGCGFGLGFGLVGGIGYGGWPWNNIRLVFGVGIGCGVGLGFGYGRGIGYGRSLESLESHGFKSDSNNRRSVIDY